MFIIRVFSHLWAYIAYRFLSFDAAREKFTQWVEGSRPKFEKDCKFSLLGTGFMYKASGAFGSVYVSPCGRFVLKMSRHDRCDKGYARFLRLALQRQNNPYYPRIYTCLQEANVQIVLMERLYPLRDRFLEARYRRLKEYSYSWSEFSGDASDPHYAQLVQDLKELFADETVRRDLHDENVMLRKTEHGRQLVVTDPAT